MKTAFRSLVTLLGLGAALLLGGCGTSLPEARPAFGYSGLQQVEGIRANYELGREHFLAARYGLAIESFRLAMADDPSSVEAVNGLAASYDQIGRFDLAERYYRRALAMDPNSAQTLNNLGYSMHLQGKNDLAVALFNDAIRQSPDDQVVTANANRAVAALTRSRSAQVARNATAAGSAPVDHLSAGKPAERPRARVVRITPDEQKLELLRPEGPKAKARPSPGGPAVAPPPLIPVEIQPLPAVYRVEDVPTAPEPASALPSVRVAEVQKGRDVVVAVSEPAAPPTVDLSGTLEVANGTGRRHMAARMGAYLSAAGFPEAWLSNADHFSHRTTTITYRAGHRRLAEALSASLPIAPRLKEVAEQAADVRIELGGDLLEFDHGLLQAERNMSNADAV